MQNSNEGYDVCWKDVERKNRYGDPSKDILEMLHEAGVEILCIDKNSNVDIVSHGKKWWMEY